MVGRQWLSTDRSLAGRLILGLIPSVLLAGAAIADDAVPPRTITVTGHASIAAVPDIAHVNVSVQRRDADMRAARDATVAVTRQFLTLTKRLGIKDNKVRTSGLTIQPEYRWDNENNEQVFTGYFVQRQLEVELDDLDRLGELLEGAIDIGVNQVSPPRLASSRRAELNREALAAAARDARSNAAEIAGSLGVTLGPLRQLDAAGSFAPPPRPMMVGAAMMRESDMAAKTYEAGEISTEANVTASFDVLAGAP